MKKSELRQIIKEEIEKELSSNPKGIKVEDLKLYNTYKRVSHGSSDSNEYIYIGIDNTRKKSYWFLFKNPYQKTVLFSKFREYGLNPEEIFNNLDIETHIHKNGWKYIKGYSWVRYPKEYFEENSFMPVKNFK